MAHRHVFIGTLSHKTVSVFLPSNSSHSHEYNVVHPLLLILALNLKLRHVHRLVGGIDGLPFFSPRGKKYLLEGGKQVKMHKGHLTPFNQTFPFLFQFPHPSFISPFFTQSLDIFFLLFPVVFSPFRPFSPLFLSFSLSLYHFLFSGLVPSFSLEKIGIFCTSPFPTFSPPCFYPLLYLQTVQRNFVHSNITRRVKVPLKR